MQCSLGSKPRGRRWKPVAVLLVVAAAIQLATLPRFRYRGDNLVARAETIRLVQDGVLGFPPEAKTSPELGGLFRERGKFFYENDAKGLVYSKYGFGHTLLYVPPVLVDLALGGPIRPIVERESLRVVIGFYNVIFAVAIALNLYRIASLYTPSASLRIAFALAAIYPSYVWYYLRAPTLEVYQLFFFVAFCAHLLAFLRGAATPDAGGRRTTVDLLGASFSAGFLLLLRPTFGVLVPLVCVAATFAGPEKRLGHRIAANLRSRRRRLSLAGVAPALVLTAGWLVVNAVKTGSPLDPGYSQWVGQDGLPASHFTLSAFPAAVRGVLIEPGNYNVFLHQPLLVIALLGWSVFVRRHRAEALAVLAVTFACVAPIMVVSNWHGEWCYGPRYLVHAVLVLCIPAVHAVRTAASFPRVAKWLVSVPVAAVLASSLALQVQINSVPYFVFQESAAWFESRGAEERIRCWFQEPRLRSVYAWQLKRFVEAGDALAPFEMALERLPPAFRAHARDDLRRAFRAFVMPNWQLSASTRPPDGGDAASASR